MSLFEPIHNSIEGLGGACVCVLCVYVHVYAHQEHISGRGVDGSRHAWHMYTNSVISAEQYCESQELLEKLFVYGF
jgi:hypothetical protein